MPSVPISSAWPILPFWLVTSGVFVLGLFLGSFVSALSWRMPRGYSILSIDGSKRSVCPHCRTALGVRDLVPLFSYLFSGGKCRHCHKKISRRYPLIELMTAVFCTVLFVFTPLAQASIPGFLIMMMLALTLSAILAIDLEHKIIPNRLNIAVGVLGAAALLLPYITAAASLETLGKTLGTAALTAAVYGILPIVIRYVFFLVTKKDALGFGDIKFFAAAGLWLSLSALPLFLIISGLGGILLGLVWKKATGEDAFPFGPALIIAFTICLCLPEKILSAFL
ncbi:MAG: prepilin peptidase [Alphaproteobacteria bacterium]|nr:MAG: prepilin peptidase [Alphaproteobacteria bacterium]